MQEDAIVARLGGPGVLGVAPNSEMDMVRAVCRGLPSQVLEHVLEAGDLMRTEAYKLVGSRSSLIRRLQEQRRLTVDQSDRLVRVISVIMLAERCWAIVRLLTTGCTSLIPILGGGGHLIGSGATQARNSSSGSWIG